MESADMRWPQGTMLLYKARQRSLKAAAMGTLAGAVAAVGEVQQRACWQVVLHMPGAGTQGAVLAAAHRRCLHDAGPQPKGVTDDMLHRAAWRGSKAASHPSKAAACRWFPGHKVLTNTVL